MAVGDVYQTQVFYNIGSERTMNVIHWREVVTCTDPIPAQTVAEMVYNEWFTRYGSLLFSDESNVVLITARRIKPTAGVPATLIIGAAGFPAIVGTGVGSPVPSTSAALISLYTDLNTKNGRGRIYLPGVQSAAQNDGQLTAAQLGELNAFADDLESDFVAVGGGTGEWHCTVYSRTLGTDELVVQAIGHSNMASQRGRRNFPGLGV